MENGGMEDILAVILGAEPMDSNPMRPGMHGKMEAKGGMSAEEVLMKIDKIIKCWKEGGPEMEDGKPEGMDEMPEKKPMKEGNDEFQEGPEEREGEGEGKRKPFQKRR